MDLVRHLRFFTTLAEVRHYGEAASVLGMTQPPLSQGIMRLERSLDVRLFLRGPGGVSLTEEGLALLPLARDVLDRADALRAGAQALATVRPVRLGLGTGLAPVLERLLVAARSVTPEDGAGVEPVVGPDVALADQVAAGTLDLAVVQHPGVVDGTDAGPVVRLPGRLRLPPDPASVLREPVAEGDAVRLHDVLVPVAVPPRHHHPPVHDQLVQLLRRHRHGTGVVACDDPWQARALVAAGRAVELTLDPVGTWAVEADVLALRWRVLAAVPHRRRDGVPHEALVAALTEALPGA